MKFYKTPDFATEPDFHLLYAPLPDDDFKQLEQDILNFGCTTPILIWHNYIIDGTKRYEICKKHKIPFSTKYQLFESKEEVIHFICTSQLNKNYISEEMRKYLIGRLYDADKVIGARLNYDTKEYHEQMTSASRTISHCKNRTATVIGQLYNICYSTVYKYNVFAKCIDSLYKKHPTITSCILRGDLKVSHALLEKMVSLPEERISFIESQIYSLNREKLTQRQMPDTFSSLAKRGTFAKTETVLLPSLDVAKRDVVKPEIKNLPAYDPDADLKSLTLTIPSWISSINRTKVSV